MKYIKQGSVVLTEEQYKALLEMFAELERRQLEAEKKTKEAEKKAS